MKKYILFLLVFLPIIAFSQVNSLASFETTPAFIKNKGQFDGRNWQNNSKIEYGIDYDDSYVFFTKKGLTYRFDKIIRNPNRDKRIHDSPKRTNISELIHVSWIGSNSDVEIIAQDEASAYYSYAIRDFETKEVRNENYIKGYKKLIYKNLYDNIDVEYIFHPETGFKYSIILHQGADISQIKMKYSKGHTKIGSEHINYQLNQLGQIEIKTSQGEITEHNPFTFYKNTKQELQSNFIFENDILSFNLENYDNTQEIVIDPWVQSPNFNTSTAVWEVETDGSGNVYVIGGETPMELRKYNSAGTWQWTYVTPWDTASVWLGTLATDDAGISYITSGTSPEIERITTVGGMVWHTNGSGMSDEYWSITFNCDKTKLIVGGTILNMFAFEAFATIFDIDLTNGDVLSSQNLAQTSLMGIGATPIEVRSISSSKDAKYVFLTHEEVGAINQNIGVCPNDQPIFQVDNGHHLGYKCENYLPATQNGGGLKALVANDQYFYTNSGDEIHKRLLSDGSLITSVNLAGGNSSTVPIIGGLVVENSGLDVDDCGNVYAGSGDRVVKFDQDLNFISESLLPFTVYDVSVNSNGEVLAVGSQADNQSVNRNGKIQAVNMSACAQFALICCDVNICPVVPVCDYDPPFDIIVSSPGGTFSGTGITNATTGTFDPSVAGVGIHTITYTKPCGSETIDIEVLSCDPIEVCDDGTDYIATGGSASLTWYDWETATINVTNQTECTTCGGIWNPGFPPLIPASCSVSSCSTNDWVQIGTGTTLNPISINSWPIMITDGMDTVTYNNAAEIPPCAPCTNPTLSAVATDVICAGDSDGSIDLTVTPGSGTTFTYSWTGPSGYTATSEDISGLLAGDYNITVTDATNPTCFAILTVTVNDGMATDDASFTVSDYCEGATNSATITGTSGGTFSFNPIPTNGETINSSTGAITGGIGGNTYTIEYTTNGVCPASSTQTVTVNANPVPSISGSTSFCTGGSTTLDAGAYSVYIWSTGATSQTIIVSTAGTYIVTVTDANGCTGTAQVDVTIAANLTPSITGVLSICSGAATILDAGAGYTTYLWSTGDVTQTINVTIAGTYSVTVSDGGGPSTFWLEDFQNGCASGCYANAYVGSNGAWTVTNTGANGADANAWFVSGTECGNAAGACGTACGATDPSLHVGSTTVSMDPGAAYMAGGLGFWFPETDKRVESPTIDCSGQTSITISFNYMEDGQLAIDNSTLWYFDGAVWSQLVDLAKTATTCAPQGLWTAYSIALPASADNNPNVKIGFRWVNNDDNIGTDPSFAVDDIEFSVVGGGSCTGTDQVVVTLNNNPTPSITGALSFCTGNSTILDAGAGYTDYAWNPSGTTQTISVNTAGTYTVTVTDANGCTGTDQVDVTVAANLSPIITGVLTICSGSATILDAGAGYTNYLWSTGDITPTINVTTAGTYSVTVSDATGCTGSDQVDVTTNTNPIPSITGALSFCTGDSTILDAGAGYTDYVWNPSGTTQTISVNTAGTYSVTVTDNNGCTGTDQVDVTVAANLSPSITGILSICSGNSTIIDAGGGYTNYLWNTTETTQTITITTSGTYSVTVSDASGCTGVDQVTVTANPNPTPTITGNLSYCIGSSTTLDAGSYASYIWNPSGNSQIINVNTEGTYSVTVTDANGCTGTNSVIVTESEQITANLSAVGIGCNGESTGAINVDVTVGSNYTYSWSNGALTQNANNLTAGVYVVTITDAYGCTEVFSAEVTEAPQLYISLPNDFYMCLNLEETITVSATGGVPNYSYLWSTGETTTSINVSPTQTTIYTVIVTDANNCTMTNEITVYVHPPLQIEAFANHDTVCLGDAVLLSASYLGGSGPPYLLFIDGQSISLPVTVYPTNGQTYTFTIQDQCNNEAISYYTLYNHPLPPNSFAPNITEGCQPLTVQFIESSPDIGQTYSWNFYDENSYNTSSEKNPIHIFEEAGVYDISLTVIDTNGCINVDVVEDLITVYPNPHAGFIADPEIASIIKPLINFYNQTIGAVEYFWYFGDGDSSNIVSPEHWYSQTGSYVVELVVVSINNCKDTVHYTVRIKDEFTFYAPTAFSPGNNGINDYFKVFGSGIDNNNFKLIVFDRWGEIIFESDDINQGWDGRAKQGNDIVQIGSYTWLCTYRDENGILHDETGSVTVIR